MKLIIWLTGLILSFSCSHRKTEVKIDHTSYYSFSDISGSFVLKRDVKTKKGKLVTRQLVFLPGMELSPLEKTVSVAQIGSVKTKKSSHASLRPEISQHNIWFEKQRFFSQATVEVEKRNLKVVMESPEEKWNGVKDFKFPKGGIFCWFSQLPECAKIHGLLTNDMNKAVNLYVVWDSYPYNMEQYANVSKVPFQMASLQLVEKLGKEKKYSLNFGNQVVFYHFNYQNEFEKMFWISQGVSIVKNSGGQ